MLSAHYNKIFVGNNYISLAVAIIKAKQNNVLVIDDPSVILGRGWYQFIGETEKNLLKLIGQKYFIDSLKTIDNYLTEINTIIYLNDKVIELKGSASHNIRELLRKVPELFNAQMIDVLSDINETEFNNYCLEIFQKIASDVYLNQVKIEDCFEGLTSDSVLQGVYENILNNFKKSKSNLKAKQFQFVLQVIFQTLFSNTSSSLESIYLLTSILSPRYRIVEEKLIEDLTFELRALGGHVKRSRINDWEIYKGKLKYILLESYEGLIGLDNLFFFGRLPESAPFKGRFKETLFKSIEIKVQLDHIHLKHYLNKRVLFSWLDYMGSDSPHWEAYIDEDGVITGVYSYASYQGSKPEFYYDEALKVFYQSILKLLPGLSMDEFIFNSSLSHGKDLWIESRKAPSFNPNALSFGLDRLFSNDDDKVIDCLEYWGPLKARSLGLFSYLIELKRNNLA